MVLIIRELSLLKKRKPPNMKNEREIYEASLVDLIRYTFSDDKNDKDKDNKFLFALLCVLLIVGAESVKVLLRKNIGKYAIDIPMLIGAVLAFSFLSLLMLSTKDRINPQSYVVTGYVFAIIAIATAIMGIVQLYRADKAGNLTDYVGDSYILGFLAKEKLWTQNRIQLVAEPLFILSLGISFSFFNLYGGIAIMFCALSAWGRILVSRYFLGSRIQRDINAQSPNNSKSKKIDGAK